VYGNKLAATGVGVTIFGFYIGEWWVVAIVVALIVAGALAIRATKSMRQDGGI
jgi:hypothetical protein